MGKKQEIAIGIALQTQALKTCPIHNQLYRDDEETTDDENMARAFAVALVLFSFGSILMERISRPVVKQRELDDRRARPPPDPLQLPQLPRR